MKALLFIALLVFGGVAYANENEYIFDDPSPPNITNQFISNYTLGGTSSNTFTGVLAVDYKNGGGFFNLNGLSFIPVFMSTNLVASPFPENDTVTLYWYYGDLCYDCGSAPLEYVTLFPLAIPAGSVYDGTETIRGQVCTVWSYASAKFDANVTMWVNVKLSTAVRITLDSYGDTAQWDFTDTVVGPFNPAIYSPPAGVDCSPLLGAESPLRTLRTLLRIPGL